MGRNSQPNAMRLAVVILLSFGYVFAQSTTSSSTFSIEVKPTAAEQYRYASMIVRRAIEQGLDYKDAVIREAVALEVIPQRWPHEKRYGVAAYQQAVSLLTGAYDANAIRVAGRAESYMANEPEMALIEADKANALLSIGKVADAEQTCRAVIGGSALPKLDVVRQRFVLRKIGSVYERDKRFRDAADLMRRAARLGPGALDPVVDYEKSLELNYKAGATDEAAADFQSLVRATADARMKNLSSEELQRLAGVDQLIAEYKKRLKL